MFVLYKTVGRYYFNEIFSFFLCIFVRGRTFYYNTKRLIFFSIHPAFFLKNVLHWWLCSLNWFTYTQCLFNVIVFCGRLREFRLHFNGRGRFIWMSVHLRCFYGFLNWRILFHNGLDFFEHRPWQLSNVTYISFK